MIVNVITVHVKAEHISAFIAATLKNHQGSRLEPGNRRFDVIRSAEDPTRFMFYEVFTSQEAVEAHRLTAHYQIWKQTVEPWMAKPREGKSHSIIAPENDSEW
jgi:(4S)-4-hydroxy-5-phosphonooxypentane-2,3-dione isomerase